MISILDLLFPKSCTICSKYGSYLCDRCKKLFKRTLPECYICRRLSTHYLTHKKCGSPFSLDSVCVLWEYNNLSSVILKKYKYGLAYDIGSSINSLVIQALKRLQIKFCNKTVVIPVPISINRLRERGFNQTVDISKTIAEHLGCEQRTDIIYRYNGDSTHQSMLDRDERLGQKNYFYIINPSLLDTYENIIIVDDVITTGTTLEQISKVIKIYNPNISVNAICLFRGRAYYK